tara:strand:+ start:165 stop:1235 length:1071 start_codon:yes stop_codon:yes gene_type:complete
MVDDYERAIIKELQLWSPTLESKEVISIFIGGGTPSRIPAANLKNLIKIIEESTNLNKSAEITAEINPDDIPDWDINDLQNSGINRLSIGIQSFIDTELDLLDRQYTGTFAENQIQYLQSHGFKNINLDLMFGLVNHTMGNWKHSLSKAIDLEPAHLSCYSLGVEEGTLLNYRIEKGELPHPDDDLAAEQYEYSIKELQNANFIHYEISNWAKNGHQSVHNSAYWDMSEYLGIGAGAHSFLSNKRFSNVKNPREYINIMNDMQANGNQEIKMKQVVDGQDVSKNDLLNDSMIFGLRMIEGINIENFKIQHNKDPRIIYKNIIEKNKLNGLLTETDSHIKLTKKGILLSNEVFQNFI